MALTHAQLAASCGLDVMLASNWADTLDDAMQAYGITTPERQAAFLAQIAHESGRFRWLRELWGPTPAQLRYEGRADLGNTQRGDGYKYRGRGLLQTTGRANYAATRDGLRRTLSGVDVPDFEDQPDLLEAPRWAALSAAWFWDTHNCNALADGGHMLAITRRINGGTNGLDERMALWADAKAALA